MITHAQARSMAEMNWGRGGTSSSRTNRKGAFYFSCSSHGGFVIDGRALTDAERSLMKEYITPEAGTEVVRQDGSVRRFRSPMSLQSLKYYPNSETLRDVEIFFAEEDCDWAIPAVIAGIMVDRMTLDAAVETFKRWRGVSNHEVTQILAKRSETC